MSLKQLHLANIANMAYGYAKAQRSLGIESDVLCYDLTHILSMPEWYEGDFNIKIKDEWAPDFSHPSVSVLDIPKWYTRIRSQDHWVLDRSKVDPSRLIDDSWRDALVSESARYGKRWEFSDTDIQAYALLADALSTAFFGKYDIIYGYAYGAVPAMLSGHEPLVPVELGTLRDIVQVDNQLGRLLALAYRLAPHVVITNADSLKYAHELGLQNFSYIPHPVDEDVFRPLSIQEKKSLPENWRKRDHLIVAPARQCWDVKYNDKYIHAFAQLISRGRRDTTLMISEWGPDVERAKQLIGSLGIQEYIDWFDPLPEARLAQLFSAADLVVDQFGSFGTFGLIGPKAMACGTPCLLSFDPVHHDWCFDQQPPAVAATSVEEISERLHHLLKNDEERQRIGIHSREWVLANHSKRIAVDKFSAISESVMANHVSLRDKLFNADSVFSTCNFDSDQPIGKNSSVDEVSISDPVASVPMSLLGRFRKRFSLLKRLDSLDQFTQKMQERFDSFEQDVLAQHSEYCQSTNALLTHHTEEIARVEEAADRLLELVERERLDILALDRKLVENTEATIQNSQSIETLRQKITAATSSLRAEIDAARTHTDSAVRDLRHHVDHTHNCFGEEIVALKKQDVYINGALNEFSSAAASAVDRVRDDTGMSLSKLASQVSKIGEDSQSALQTFGDRLTRLSESSSLELKELRELSDASLNEIKETQSHALFEITSTISNLSGRISEHRAFTRDLLKNARTLYSQLASMQQNVDSRFAHADSLHAQQALFIEKANTRLGELELLPAQVSKIREDSQSALETFGDRLTRLSESSSLELKELRELSDASLNEIKETQSHALVEITSTISNLSGRISEHRAFTRDLLKNARTLYSQLASMQQNVDSRFAHADSLHAQQALFNEKANTRLGELELLPAQLSSHREEIGKEIELAVGDVFQRIVSAAENRIQAVEQQLSLQIDQQVRFEELNALSAQMSDLETKVVADIAGQSELISSFAVPLEAHVSELQASHDLLQDATTALRDQLSAFSTYVKESEYISRSEFGALVGTSVGDLISKRDQDLLDKIQSSASEAQATQLRLDQQIAQTGLNVSNVLSLVGSNRIEDRELIRSIRNDLLEDMVRSRLSFPFEYRGVDARVPKQMKTLSVDAAFARLRKAAPLNWDLYQMCFDEGARSYETLPATSCSTDAHKQATLFRAFIRPYLRGHILDVGCGPQPIPSYLSDVPNQVLHGIDPLSTPGDHPFHFVPGVGEYLPWEDESFDVVVSGTTLDHYYLLDVGLESAYRVLKPGGHYLAWITEFSDATTYDPYTSALPGSYDSEHLFHINREWFMPMMHDIGYREVEVIHFELPFNFLFMSFVKPDGR